MNTSTTKVKVVGCLDCFLTVALIIQIYFCTVQPILEQRGIINRENEIFSIDDTPHVYLTEAETGKKNDVETILLWSFLGLSGVAALIPILAAVTLIKSTNANIGHDRAIEMTRFWMHSNAFTIAFAALEIIIVMLMFLFGSPVWPPVPTAVYLGFRAVFTYIVGQQLETLRPRSNSQADALLVEKQEPLIARKSGRFRTNMFSEDSMGGLTMMPLGTYRGKGLSLPNCKCVAPQNV